MFKIGTLVTIHPSTRRCGKYAGKTAMIVSFDKHGQYTLLVGGEVRDFHTTQLIIGD